MENLKMKVLEEEAKEELQQDKTNMSVALLKERLKEIAQTKRVLAKLEKQYNKLLEKDIEDVFFDYE